MGKPPGHDDETRDDADPSARPHGDDPDRAAILARRQRFIALALSGLATAACDKPNDEPSAPKVDKTVQEGKDDGGTRPHPCLSIVAPEAGEGGSTGKPMPCLEVAVPEPDDESEDDGAAPPQPCLKIAAPEPKPKPHPCLSIRPPDAEPKPKPMPCLKVAPPKEPDEPKPQPCLRVAKPQGA